MSISKSVPNVKLHKPKTESHKSALSKSKKEHFKHLAISYTWMHNEHGTIFGTVYDLLNQFPMLNIKPAEMNKVISGLYKSHKGWTIIH